MKKIIAVTSLVVLLPFSSFAAEKMAEPVEQSKFGLTGKIGTLGAGLDLTINVNSKTNVRLNINGAKKSFNDVTNGIAYDGDLKLQTVGALVDFHPFSNGFRVSGGLYSNGNKIDSSSTNAQNAVINGVNYDITGTLDSKVDFGSTAPYLGLGWGNAVSGVKRLSFSFDAGVLFQGSPTAKLTGTGSALGPTGPAIDISSNTSFLTGLTAEEAKINNDLKDFKYYPVISMGMSYSF